VFLYSRKGRSSPFGGIPRNWKQYILPNYGNYRTCCSPFGGIPRNWKLNNRHNLPP